MPKHRQAQCGLRNGLRNGRCVCLIGFVVEALVAASFTAFLELCLWLVRTSPILRARSWCGAAGSFLLHTDSLLNLRLCFTHLFFWIQAIAE